MLKPSLYFNMVSSFEMTHDHFYRAISQFQFPLVCLLFLVFAELNFVCVHNLQFPHCFSRTHFSVAFLFASDTIELQIDLWINMHIGIWLQVIFVVDHTKRTIFVVVVFETFRNRQIKKIIVVVVVVMWTSKWLKC